MLQIHELFAKIKAIGLATPNRYQIIITPPVINSNTTSSNIFDVQRIYSIASLIHNTINSKNVLNGIAEATGFFDTDNTRYLSLMAESTAFPGKSFLTTDRQIYGPTYKAVYGQLFGELPVTFKVDSNMYPKTLFDSWQELIVDPNTNDANYYNNYTTDIELHQLDKLGNTVYSIKVYECYPVTVSDLVLDHNATDSFHKLQVTFAFRYWRKI